MNASRKRGSALLLTLGVLALLAIMGTTFLTMMRMDSKLNTHYVNDVQCELLARGLLEYVRGILADDLDRTMKIISDSQSKPQIAHRYENRDAHAPWIHYGSYTNRTAGLNTDDNVRNTNEAMADEFVKGTKARWGLRLGIPPSNDFWLTLPGNTREMSGAFFTVRHSYWNVPGQAGSFYCYVSEPRRIIAPLTWGWTQRTYIQGPDGERIWNPETGDWEYTEEHKIVTVDTNGVGYDIWVTLCQNGINDNPWEDNYTDPYTGQPGLDDERNSWYDFYDTVNEFLTPGGASMYLQGPDFTGDPGLPGGVYWRTALRMGMPESSWFNINVTGNLEKTEDYLTNIDGNGLKGRVVKKASSEVSYDDDHLGLMSFSGYSDSDGPFKYYGNPRNPNAQMYPYDAVCYSPLQISLRALYYDSFAGAVNSVSSSDSTSFKNWSNAWSEAVIRARYGGHNRAAHGYSRWERYRPGWRADGASFYVIPSPEAPHGSDTYFDPSEALEHATPTLMIGDSGNPAGSRLFNAAYFNVFGRDRYRTEWATLISRSRLSTLSRDDILRGKIWWTEEHGEYRDTDSNIGAHQLPGHLQNKRGEWRHISILKRVNLNILGASDSNYAFSTTGNLGGPNYVDWPSDDSTVKSLKRNRWIPKQHYEQDRCYYMLKGALLWHGYAESDAAKSACQLIACLTDMVDRDQDETKYEAPDGEAIGYGVERFPVINEVGLEINGGTVKHFRVELFNPTENIPWLPDEMEAIDLARYSLRIRVPARSIKRSVTSLDSMGNGSNFDDTLGKCLKVPLAGVNGDSNGRGRYLHVNMDDAAKLITADQFAKGVQVELVKSIKADGGAERMVDRACIWDGTTRSNLKLATFNNDSSDVYSGSGTWVGLYRRVDPMNAATYQCTGASGQCSVVHDNNSRYGLKGCGTFGRENKGYNSGRFDDYAVYNYDVKWCRDVKIPDSDLPSIGWIAEAFARVRSYADPDASKTLTMIHDGPQTMLPSGASITIDNVANQLDTKAKLDLFKPFGSSRNLHILDIFTCWDPSNDGEDNDGDGDTDEDDEVVVYGRIDVNSAKNPLVDALIGIRDSFYDPYPDSEYGRASVHMSPDYCRGRSDSDYASSPSTLINGKCGAFETIGDLLRLDRFSLQPGWGMAHTLKGNPWSASNWEDFTSYTRAGYTSGDDDGDGKVNEFDEADARFTWFANLFTTRNKVFTVEILTELTDPPYHIGHATPHKTYKINSDSIRARKHLLAILDRTTSFKVRSNGECDFNGPVRIMALRWAQINK